MNTTDPGDAGPGRSARDVVAQIRAAYPDASFLALGQTVFWDEPVKAALRSLLDSHRLGGRMVLGVHDTDYFAKAAIRSKGPKRFVLMPHNDGTTKTLWSAAGEISTLFGSETFPSRHDYIRYGVPFRKLAAVDPAGPQAFLDAVTEAWGWRGLVYTGSRDLIVSRLSLREVGDGVLDMLTWGIDHALEQIVPGCCQDEARMVADTILGWCKEYLAHHPDQTLSSLFQHVLPRLYALLLGYEPTDIEVTGTADLLRLTPETAHLPRFRFVDHFLHPDTRQIALDAYNQALAGSEIYTLDRFGAGALPFDCILPECGRGTLRISPRVLFIETPQPVAIALKKPITSVQDLAETLEAHRYVGVTLVGKAVSLVSMLAQEFVFVFNEEGSMYVKRTRQMNDLMRAAGIDLDMRPILRLRYHTWDALDVGRSTLRPAEHLASTFGRPTITTPELAASWRTVVAEQRALCTRLADIRKPLELMNFLRERDTNTPWDELIAEYVAASNELCALRSGTAEIQAEIDDLYANLKELKAQCAAAQTQRGEHFRSVREWSVEQTARREEFERQFAEIVGRKVRMLHEIDRLNALRREIERGARAMTLRATRERLRNEAERARLRQIRHALLTADGLTHTNHRPSAWWLPMVDPSGDWFRRIVETTEAYTEPLLS